MHMQFNALFLALLALFVSALSAPVAVEERQINTATFVKVALDAPLNWVEGTRLFPSAMIAGYSAGADEYDEAGYAAFILEKCRSFKACTSFMVYQGNNSGSTGGRYWFGHVFEVVRPTLPGTSVTMTPPRPSPTQLGTRSAHDRGFRTSDIALAYL
ncbi:hypothetical protein BJ742DRAFT_777450 [Cladochytrium replicatum]|nr:hypothetical protein BJ742DRAFT_777450 [Cladochytrium replicatum]